MSICGLEEKRWQCHYTRQDLEGMVGKDLYLIVQGHEARRSLIARLDANVASYAREPWHAVFWKNLYNRLLGRNITMLSEGETFPEGALLGAVPPNWHVLSHESTISEVSQVLYTDGSKVNQSLSDGINAFVFVPSRFEFPDSAPPVVYGTARFRPAHEKTLGPEQQMILYLHRMMKP